MASQPVAYVASAQVACAVLDARIQGVGERGRFFEDVARVIGSSSLVTCSGDAHRRLRRTIAPAFRQEHVARYSTTMASCCREAMSSWRPGARLDLGAVFANLTLEIASRALLGLERADQAEDFLQVLDAGARAFYRLVLPRPLSELLWRNPCSPTNRRLVAAQRRIDGLVDRLVSARANEDAACEPTLLDVLLAARDEQGDGLSVREVRDQVVTFLFAGHETTAQALTWLFVELARAPRVEERVVAELCAHPLPDRPGPEDVNALRYTRAAVREALRLHPPAWFLSREATSETTIGGCPVAEGSLVLVSPLALHRDPRHFEDPLAFRPERFLDGDVHRSDAYLPFGHGRRNCIGAAFALTEMVVVCATMLPAWHLEVDRPEDVTERATVTLRPKNRVRATIHRRGSSK